MTTSYPVPNSLSARPDSSSSSSLYVSHSLLPLSTASNPPSHSRLCPHSRRRIPIHHSTPQTREVPADRHTSAPCNASRRCHGPSTTRGNGVCRSPASAPISTPASVLQRVCSSPRLYSLYPPAGTSAPTAAVTRGRCHLLRI